MFPTVILSGAKSSIETPNSPPVMVMVVPPSRGPIFGLKSIITGGGQFDPSSTTAVKFEQSSSRLQLSMVLELEGPLHQPHSNPSTNLKLVHEEQPLVSLAQL